jgi:hypothetical protein
MLKNKVLFRNLVWILSPALLFCSLSACHQQSDQSGTLQKQIDSLNSRINNAYSPGLGEFMTSIQMHHAKLWFAGKNGNWELAQFEIGEIQESLDGINKYNRDRPEIKEIPMIDIPMDSLKAAITAKNMADFKNGFKLLTNTCNNCHAVTKHGFNKIKIPDVPPVTNQVFDKP